MTLYVASRDRSLGGDWVRRHFEPINLTRFVVLMSTGVATSITVGLPHRRERHPLKTERAAAGGRCSL
jgi:hypothetical protein